MEKIKIKFRNASLLIFIPFIYIILYGLNGFFSFIKTRNNYETHDNAAIIIIGLLGVSILINAIFRKKQELLKTPYIIIAKLKDGTVQTEKNDKRNICWKLINEDKNEKNY